MSVPEFSAAGVAEVSALLRGQQSDRTASDAPPDAEVDPGLVTGDVTADTAEAEEAPAVADPEEAPEEDEAAATEEDADLNADGGLNMKEAAELLEMDEQTLWDTLMVPVGEGESLSVTELRDGALANEHIEGAWAEFDEANHAREMEYYEQRREIETLYATLQDKGVTPEDVRIAEGRQEAYQERQWNLLASAWPEYNDETTRQEWRGKLLEVGQSYGYSRAELAVLNDARAILALRDLYKAKERDKVSLQRLKNAKLSRAERGTRARGGKRGASPANEIVNRARTGDRDAKVAGVSALLRGK